MLVSIEQDCWKEGLDESFINPAQVNKSFIKKTTLNWEQNQAYDW